MKVLKVIVDELPEWCYACDFWNNNVEYQSDYCKPDTKPYLCDILQKEIDQNIFKVNRPDWCPLVSLNELTWLADSNKVLIEIESDPQ